MAIYELSSMGIRPIEQTTFARVDVGERADLQRVLRDRIDIVDPEILVISEEFGDWEDSRRRIDLLAIDRDARLVVIELKRTEDGGLMDLQAIRYAAMVSTMTFEKVIDAYSRYLTGRGVDEDARAKLLDFLGWEEPDEEQFAQDVRIVLVSAEFSKEVTSAVIWLNGQGLDIRCIRLKPYADNGRVLLDVQQVIPLPEAAEFQVQFREKQQRERDARTGTRDRTRFDVTVKGVTHHAQPKRHAILLVVKGLVETGVSPEEIAGTVPWRSKFLWKMAGRMNSTDFIEVAKSRAAEVDRVFDATRYFCKDEELIWFGDATHAVSNQWGRRAQEAIELMLAKYPDRGVACTVAK